MLSPYALTCEYFTDPLGIDVPQPRLSWKLEATHHPARQAAYEIEVTGDEGANLWQTGKLPSDQSIHVRYEGTPLQPRQRCRWRVRVWDGDDTPSAWSEPARWEMGLMEPTAWQGDWITPAWEEDLTAPQPAPLLRRHFSSEDAGSKVARARLYATSLGLYELHLNGQRVGDGVLTPGWTTYKERIQYQTYDVTDLVNAGENVIGAMLGDGWYRGHLGFERERNLYGDQLALLVQLEITYDDGRTVTVTSDDAWQASTGPIRMADIYWGEHYDARAEKPGWSTSGYDDSDWQSVKTLDHPKSVIVAQRGPFIQRQEELRPRRIFQTPAGETVVDFGQNMVGWVRLRVNGPAGTTVTLRHIEVLDQDGNVYTENLRFAKQEAQYTLKGEGEEVYEPRFTFFGFQYVAIEGFPTDTSGEPTVENFTGVVVHSEMAQIGDFSCSNELINQLQHNILWGQKGNFVDVPTDCPQRDERLGWTGDAQVFIRTACFNMDVAPFFTKWLADMRADQQENGSVSFVVPDVLTREGGSGPMTGNGAAAWSDAMTICPWTLYLCYGDRALLAENYASMVAWVGYMQEHADDDLVWRKGFQFGDWLDFRGSFALKPSPVTNDDLVGTAFFAHSAALVSRAAAVLGKEEDAETYAALSAAVKSAFCREYVTPNGRIGGHSQTGYVLALHFDLLPAADRQSAADRLAELVRENDYHLTTGFVGTPYLCHVLSCFGHLDVAYELLNQESFPSWIYPVRQGATTIWERWDGIKPDGSFQDASMNSFNHYAYGAIGDWLYGVVAGLEVDPAAPGYAHIRFRPRPGGGLTHARATLNSPYGPVESAWELGDDALHLRVTVPPNARGTVILPAESLERVSLDGQSIEDALSTSEVTLVEGEAHIEIGSGTYAFTTTGLTLSQAMAGVRHVAGRLDRYCRLSDLLADDSAAALLQRELGPDLLAGPGSRFLLNRPLVAIAESMPQLLPEEKLVQIERELAR